MFPEIKVHAPRGVRLLPKLAVHQRTVVDYQPSLLLLAAPAALAQQRNNQTALLMFSLASGLLFLMVDGVLTALGQTNVLPPLLGAWAGPALFTALAGAALVHLEG